MTNFKVKKEITEEFSGIKYILTSGMRSRLLLSIYQNPKNLDDLRNELKKPSATILHGLKELETMNLIKKVQKSYELTSNGFLLTTNMVKLIENWYSVNRNKLFWNSHDLSQIPEDMLKNIYLLKDAQYVTSTTSDLSNAYNTYLKLISNARRLKIILPIYSENHLKYLTELLDKRKLENLELIINKKILNSLKKNDMFNKHIIKNNKVKIKCLDTDLKVFLTCGDSFMSLTLFFNDGHYDDSQMLIAKDDNAIKWAMTLATYY
jgi:predicted transcriptional regulator